MNVELSKLQSGLLVDSSICRSIDRACCRHDGKSIELVVSDVEEIHFHLVGLECIPAVARLAALVVLVALAVAGRTCFHILLLLHQAVSSRTSWERHAHRDLNQQETGQKEIASNRSISTFLLYLSPASHCSPLLIDLLLIASADCLSPSWLGLRCFRMELWQAAAGQLFEDANAGCFQPDLQSK